MKACPVDTLPESSLRVEEEVDGEVKNKQEKMSA